MVIFVGNVTFFNRMRILNLVLTEDIADSVALEIRSSLPTKDKVATLVEIPKKGVRAVRIKKHLIRVQA